MIKITVQLPPRGVGGITPTPFEVSVPAIPRDGDGFRTSGGELFEVSGVYFQEERNKTCSIVVLLSDGKVSAGVRVGV
jgi:hypothetical protein